MRNTLLALCALLLPAAGARAALTLNVTHIV